MRAARLIVAAAVALSTAGCMKRTYFKPGPLFTEPEEPRTMLWEPASAKWAERSAELAVLGPQAIMTATAGSNGIELAAQAPSVCPRVDEIKHWNMRTYRHELDSPGLLPPMGVAALTAISIGAAFYIDGFNHGMPQDVIDSNPYAAGQPSRGEILLPGHISVGIGAVIGGWALT